jgi:hypothetical protein
MKDLRFHLHTLANEFVSSILDAMKTAPLVELVDSPAASRTNGVAAKRGRGRPPANDQSFGASASPLRARRRRASSEEIQGLKDQVLATAKQLGPGFSKRDVSKKTKSKIDLSRILALLVAEGKLRKKGDRRLARYSTE